MLGGAVMRILFLALAVFAVGPAAAAEPFPTSSDAWHLEARAPAHAGEARFARIEATPNLPAGWKIFVACGRVSLRTGKETVTYRGKGRGTRGRMMAFGGQVADGAGVLQGFLVDQQGDALLDVPVLFAAPGEDRVCPNGRGDISTGDYAAENSAAAD